MSEWVNPWDGRVLLTQMDWIRVRFAFDFEPFCWLNCNPSTACKRTKRFFRTEALGLSLAAFFVALPFNNIGAIPMDQTSIPQGCEQIFVISQNVSDTQEEDLAWAMYILLRNTNTTAVSIADVLGWFEKQIESISISDVKETLYLSQIEGSYNLGII
ncbi:unnamed protein product [Malus baccata var. baccata]